MDGQDPQYKPFGDLKLGLQSRLGKGLSRVSSVGTFSLTFFFFFQKKIEGGERGFYYLSLGDVFALEEEKEEE